jgi:hypothetical protein
MRAFTSSHDAALCPCAANLGGFLLKLEPDRRRSKNNASKPPQPKVFLSSPAMSAPTIPWLVRDSRARGSFFLRLAVPQTPLVAAADVIE